MRIDKFLKNSRLIKRRTIAKDACDGGRVSINDKVAKAGDVVKLGDLIEIRFGSNTLRVEVVDVPKVATKESAGEMYRIVE